MSKLSGDTLREGIAGTCRRASLDAALCLYYAGLHMRLHQTVPASGVPCLGLAPSACWRAGVLEGSRTKERKFKETIELQVGLKNYDPAEGQALQRHRQAAVHAAAGHEGAQPSVSPLPWLLRCLVAEGTFGQPVTVAAALSCAPRAACPDRRRARAGRCVCWETTSIARRPSR